MVVEDDKTMLDLLSALFALEGYQVVFVDQEIGLIDSMKYHKPDLVLMDVHLRQGIRNGLNGFDYLERIRSDQELQNKKIVMVSGMDFRLKSSMAGADDFIVKPFMPDELIGKIKNLLE